MTSDFGAQLNVSRETLERLEIFTQLLLKWNPAINLVSKSTVDSIWTRHILDSAQLVDLAPKTFDSWTDLGSGGGFPGVVVALMTSELKDCGVLTLVEADQRKAAFLRAVSRETSVNFEVVCERIEHVKSKSSVISARALAPLSKLLELSRPLMKPSSVALFPKGRKVDTELQEARQKWKFQCEVLESQTDVESVVLRIGEIEHA